MRKLHTTMALVLIATGAFSAREARATNFAILLGGGKNEGSCTESIKGTGMSLGGLRVIFPADLVDRPMLLEIETAPLLPEGTPKLAGASYAFGLKLTDVATGQPITQFAEPVTICFVDLSTAVPDSGLALGYLAEQFSPPVWEVQDAAPKRNTDGYLCGNTDHFTTFALAETSSVPEPGFAGVAGLAGAMVRRRRA